MISVQMVYQAPDSFTQLDYNSSALPIYFWNH